MKRLDVSTKKYPNLFALVDDEDFEHLNQWKWSADKRRKTFYAIRSVAKDGRRTTVRMHVEIMGARPGVEIDHQDGDGLNNQRLNLRPATEAQNQWNVTKRGGETSSYKGVSWCSRFQRWKSHISVNGVHTFLGSYPSEELAAAAYNFAARRAHGAFARVNEGILINEQLVAESRFRSSRWAGHASKMVEAVLEEFEK